MIFDASSVFPLGDAVTGMLGVAPLSVASVRRLVPSVGDRLEAPLSLAAILLVLPM